RSIDPESSARDLVELAADITAFEIGECALGEVVELLDRTKLGGAEASSQCLTRQPQTAGELLDGGTRTDGMRARGAGERGVEVIPLDRDREPARGRRDEAWRGELLNPLARTVVVNG